MAAPSSTTATATAALVEIDGSQGEGGGQIVRNACSQCAIFRKPLRIANIRAGRDKPGLRAQHLTGIELVAAMCGGRLAGAAVGSTAVELWPGALAAATYVADAQTAGSTCLLLQIALPCAVFAPGPCSLRLKGGTNAAMVGTA